MTAREMMTETTGSERPHRPLVEFRSIEGGKVAIFHEGIFVTSMPHNAFLLTVLKKQQHRISELEEWVREVDG